MASDEELMLSAAGGDMEAFGELVLRHQDRAWRTAYHYVANRADAEELAQEAFLRILGAAASYRPSARFTTYLYRVVANLCLDHRRKKRPDRQGDLSRRASSLPSPDAQMEAREREETVRRALDRLPDRQRMAVVLRYYEELPLREIAATMDATPKAVERLLARARECLAAELGAWTED